jgi:DNA (cytosine-5)-methyltransferase 1
MKIYPTKSLRLLDLFCGAGAASVGYADAGFECVGVDLFKQENYPYEFHQFDAMQVVANKGLIKWLDIDIIHASPPCQAYSVASSLAYESPRLIEPLRDLLLDLLDDGLIRGYVIENVMGAPLGRNFAARDTERSDTIKQGAVAVGSRIDNVGGVIQLCGTQFGKKIARHRLFEYSEGLDLVTAGFPCDHDAVGGIINIFGSDVRNGGEYSMTDWMKEMFEDRSNGRQWLTQVEAKQAIPPCYTEYVGLQIQRQFGA